MFMSRDDYNLLVKPNLENASRFVSETQYQQDYALLCELNVKDKNSISLIETIIQEQGKEINYASLLLQIYKEKYLKFLEKYPSVWDWLVFLIHYNVQCGSQFTKSITDEMNHQRRRRRLPECLYKVASNTKQTEPDFLSVQTKFVPSGYVQSPVLRNHEFFANEFYQTHEALFEIGSVACVLVPMDFAPIVAEFVVLEMDAKNPINTTNKTMPFCQITCGANVLAKSQCSSIHHNSWKGCDFMFYDVQNADMFCKFIQRVYPEVDITCCQFRDMRRQQRPRNDNLRDTFKSFKEFQYFFTIADNFVLKLIIEPNRIECEHFTDLVYTFDEQKIWKYSSNEYTDLKCFKDSAEDSGNATDQTTDSIVETVAVDENEKTAVDVLPLSDDTESVVKLETPSQQQ